MRPLACVLIVLSIAGIAGCPKSSPPAPASADAAVFDSNEVADKSIETNCGVCHTLDMVRSQRLTRAQWEKELKKMTGWGAQIPPQELPLVLNRLEEKESITSPDFVYATLAAADVPALVLPDETPVSGDPARGSGAYAGACQGCHGPTGKGAIGPNLLDRPVLFRGADFQKVVREGRQKMPGFAATFDAKAIDDLRAFLQSRHDD